MSEFALRRVLVRRRRRKPRPPRWWLCVLMLAALAGAATLAAVDSKWLSLGCDAGNIVVWWRALHSPPLYWDSRAFWIWWPPSMALGTAGLFA